MAPAVLIVRAGPLAGRRIELEHDVVLGREGADVTIQDPQLSRRHAAIKLVDGGLEIEDLESLNGTYVNAGRIEASTRLAAGDLVQIGKTSFEVEIEHAEPDASETRAPAPERGAGETRGAQRAAPAAPAREPQPPPAAAPPPARVEAPQAAFGALAPARRRRRWPATRRLTPTLLSFAAIIASAAALIVYFAGR